MSTAVLIAAALAALTAATVPFRGPGPLRRSAGGRPASAGSEGTGGPGARGRPPPAGSGAAAPWDEPAGSAARWARPASVLAGAAAWLLLGGPIGAAVGVGLAVGLPVALARMEPAATRRRRLALIRSAPVVADLLAASLSAGVPLERAVPVVARAVGGPTEGVLREVQRRSDLGEPAERAWAGLSGLPGLGGLATAVARSSRTGAPLAGLLSLAAQDLRGEAAAAALVEVRATAVRSVLPLGLCLLPAFVLLGIVPVVGGLLASL